MEVLYLHADTISTMGHLPALATPFPSLPILTACLPFQQPVQCAGFFTVTGKVNCRIRTAKFSQFFVFLMATLDSPCSPQGFVCWMVSHLNIAIINILTLPLQRSEYELRSICSMDITWEVVRNAESQAWSETWIRICTLAQYPDDSHMNINVLEALLASLALILFFATSPARNHT